MTENLFIKKNFTLRLICEQNFYSQELQSVFDNPDFHLLASTTPILQDNFKSRIGVITVNGRKIVIKRHNFKSRWQQFKRYFRPTKSSKSWYYSKLLLKNNVPIPQPIAYLEKRFGPLRRISYFFYEYVEGIQGKEYIKQMSHSPEKAHKVIAAVLNIIDTIQSLRLIHGDIRLANFIFNGEKLYLIDFDDVRKRSWYKPQSMKNRDIRGFRKDLCFNAPESLLEQVLAQLDHYCLEKNITISGPDYQKVSL